MEEGFEGHERPASGGPVRSAPVPSRSEGNPELDQLSGRVVGQIQRYMGYVKEKLAEPNQTVRGVIIAFEDDVRIHRALSVAQNIEFYTYKIQFKLKNISK